MTTKQRALIMQSINKDYLPANWYNLKGLICLTESGFFSLKNLCIEVEKTNEETNEKTVKFFHKILDVSLYAYDEFSMEFIESIDAVFAFANDRREVVTNVENCIVVNGIFYIEQFANEYNIIELFNGDFEQKENCYFIESEQAYYLKKDCYYWFSTGQWETTEEHINTADLLNGYSPSRSLFEYHSGHAGKSFINEDHEPALGAKFGIGFEIEKNAMPDFAFNKSGLYEKTGAAIEQDCSVSSGFELVTPTYNLMSRKTDCRLKQLAAFCDVQNVAGAGGHIGFSMEGKRDVELLDLCAGWLPLIYSMHKARLTNSYCSGQKIEQLKNSGEKYQSISLRGRYIEFRIIGAVRSYENLKFRLELFRIMAKNLGKSFTQVLSMAINKRSELYKLLKADTYKENQKFCRLINDAIFINGEFGNEQLSQTVINTISQRLSRMQTSNRTAANAENLPVNTNG